MGVLNILVTIGIVIFKAYMMVSLTGFQQDLKNKPPSVDEKSNEGDKTQKTQYLPGPVDIIVIPGSLKTDMITVDIGCTDYHIHICIGYLN